MNLDKSISIIGCGISGIFAALHLKKAGLKNIRLFDKSRGVGGRLATRRSSEGKFDHGAQYLKLDDIYDLPEIKSLIKNNILKETKVPNVYIGDDGMTSIPKFLSKDLSVSKEFKLIRINENKDKISLIFENGEEIISDSIIFSSPIKQSIEILDSSSVNIDKDKFNGVRSLEYSPGIILMVESENSINLNSEFFQEDPSGNFSFISDNFRKTISKKENFYTLICSTNFSVKNFEKEYDEINSILKPERDIIFNKKYNILSNHKWRYSIPTNFYPNDDSLNIGLNNFIGMCGDIFTNGNFGGAIKSGISIAEKYMKNEV